MVDGAWNTGDSSDRTVFYMLNMEHAQAEANMQVANATNVDIFGLKVEGSLPVLWVSDSMNVTLFGMGGGADAFPDRSYYPSDLAPYPPSMIRMERSSGYRLINLFDGGRGAEGTPPRPIGAFPLTQHILKAYDFYGPDVPGIIQSMWSPWPGYAVAPSEWSLVWDGDDVGHGTLSTPADRPVLYSRDTTS